MLYMCKDQNRKLIFGYAHLPSSLAVGVIALLLLAGTAFAADDREGLKEEINRLKQDNAELQKRLESQAHSIDRLTQRVESLEQKSPAPPLKEPATPSKDEAMAAMATPNNASPFTVPRQTLQWFGDVNFRADGKVRGAEQLPSSFSLGQLGLMVNSRLTDNASVMSEIVFQYKDDESASATIERLQLQYQANDLFNFRVGRTHTPFGYWNETFHHGTWFQTTALRPEIMRFHDGGSVLPIHSVGLEMYGYQPLDVLDIYYHIGVANGRGSGYTDTADIQDLNGNKAVYGVLSLAPAAVSGLRFGVNVYKDVIPPDARRPARNGEIDELITGAHLVYVRDRLEFLSEAMRIRHDDRASSRRFTTRGMYVQASYRLGAFRPYYRFDRLDAAKGDPFYGPFVLDVIRHTLGLRWDFIARAALKFEYHYIDQLDLNSPNAVYTQAAFTF
jgi:hypothetical protein